MSVRTWCVLILVALLVASCQMPTETEHAIIGTWVSDPPEELTLMFHDDRSMVLDDPLRRSVFYGTWSYDDSVLTITLTRFNFTDIDPARVLEIRPRTATRLCWPSADPYKVCFTKHS